MKIRVQVEFSGLGLNDEKLTQVIFLTQHTQGT